jgi:fibronectin type 3 domain-containing protein
MQWTTNEAATARVDYGTSSSNLNLNVSSATLATSRTLTLPGLTSQTTYFYRVTSVDAAGNSTTTPTAPAAPLSFTTLDVTPPTISAISATPAGTSATIQWTTNESATARVDYGTSSSNLNLNVSSAALATSRTLTLPTLASGTTYFYRVTSVDAAGNSATTPTSPAAPLSFTTLDITPPTISAITATPSPTSATIQWNTNESANARVNYGTSSSNLNLNVTSATLATSRTLTLTGLTANTTYFYRVVSADAAGNSTTSPNPPTAPLSFVTPAQPSSVTILTGTLNSGNAASLANDDNNNYQVNSTTTGTRTTAWYATFTNIPNNATSLRITYRGSNSNTCSQDIDIWNWSGAGSWSTMDNNRNVGTTEVTVANLVPSGTIANYISGTTGSGDVRVRVICTDNGSFTSRGEFMQLQY